MYLEVIVIALGSFNEIKIDGKKICSFIFKLDVMVCTLK